MNEKTEVPLKCGHFVSLPSVNGLSALNSVICYPRRGGHDARFLDVEPLVHGLCVPELVKRRCSYLAVPGDGAAQPGSGKLPLDL